MTRSNDPMAEIRASFFVECDDLIESLQDGLDALAASCADSEAVNVVFRAVHSIKGGAGAFGLAALVAFAHRFETVLDAVRSGRLSASPEAIKLFYRAADLLADEVRAARDSSPAPEGAEAVLSGLEALTGDSDGHADDAAGDAGEAAITFQPLVLSLDLDFGYALVPADSAEDDVARDVGERGEAMPDWLVRFQPRRDLFLSGNEPLMVLRGLTALGRTRVTCDLTRLPGIDALDPEESYLGWSVTLPGQVEEAAIRAVFDFVEDVSDVDIQRGTVEGRTDAADAEKGDGTGGTAAGPGADDANRDGVEPMTAGPGDTVAGLPNGPERAFRSAGRATMLLHPAPAAGSAQSVPLADDVPPTVPPTLPSTALPSQSAPAPAAPAPAAPAPAAPAPAAPAPATASSAPSVPSAPSAPAAATADANATVRVSLDRVDRLVNLVGELIINQAMLAQGVIEAGLPPTSPLMSGLDTYMALARDIQDSVMMIRAQPVKPLFQRMARIAREASAAVGKDIRLVTEGEATEVDKTVIERLADPLTHMIRNSVDHGIETVADRLAAGKPALGTVTLSARHRSGRIMIEVADDGAGIDRDRVRAKALAKGLVPPDAVLSDGEIDNLLFLPGFSTADAVSNLSGRGVGMDVVKRAIQGLGGRISISSQRGKGTRFEISLPLTLAVLDGMIVAVAGETLVIPLSSVIETATLTSADIRPVSPGQNVAHVRGGFVPIFYLADVLGYRGAGSTGRGADRTILLVATEGGGRVALAVDTIVEQRQVVIKGLPDGFVPMAGIAAATILGDGNVALIVDPVDLVRAAAGSRRDLRQRLAG